MKKPPTYTVTGLAAALDVDHPTVSRWKAAGLPFGANGRVALPAAVAWIRQHERRQRPAAGVAPGADEVERRRNAIALERDELRLLRELESVVDRAAVEQAAEEEATRVGVIVTAMATEDAPFVAAQCGCTVRVASAMLRGLADRVRTRLADAGDGEPGEEATADATPAAAVA